MKKFDEWMLPDHEKHLQEWMTTNNDRWMGRLSYQAKKQRAALDLLPRTGSHRVAIDIGAHVGLWSYYLAKFFLKVEAFEPILEHRLCFNENVHAENVTLHPFALGDEEGTVGMHTEPSSSGDSYPKGKGDTPVRRLDSFGFSTVDFIKADCEGYEYFALHGGEQLIKTCRPVIIVEQKPGKAQKYGLEETHAVDYLISLGMKLEREISGDFLMVWRR